MIIPDKIYNSDGTCYATNGFQSLITSTGGAYVSRKAFVARACERPHHGWHCCYIASLYGYNPFKLIKICKSKTSTVSRMSYLMPRTHSCSPTHTKNCKFGALVNLLYSNHWVVIPCRPFNIRRIKVVLHSSFYGNCYSGAFAMLPHWLTRFLNTQALSLLSLVESSLINGIKTSCGEGLTDNIGTEDRSRCIHSAVMLLMASKH